MREARAGQNPASFPFGMLGFAKPVLLELWKGQRMVLCCYLGVGYVAGVEYLFFQRPMTAWSLVHAAWIRNRFVVQEGQTAFERAFDRVYNGRICSFGEVVLAFVKTSKKGAPSWRKGVWLTKSNSSDVHVVGIGEHIVCTRSVRRLSKQWDLKLISWRCSC